MDHQPQTVSILIFFLPPFQQIKSREGDEKKYGSDIESDSDSEEGNKSGLAGAGGGLIGIYTEMLGYLKQGETVARALKV